MRGLIAFIAFSAVFIGHSSPVTVGDWATRVEISPGQPGNTPTPAPGVSIEYDCGESKDCNLNRFMERTDACALFVIKGGEPKLHLTAPTNSKCESRVRKERYGIASVAKSLTSLLFGIVLADPAYGDPVDLNAKASSALGKIGLHYLGDATFLDLLRMSSGMDWTRKEEKIGIRIEADEDGNQTGPYRTLFEAVSARLENAKFDPSKRFFYSGFDSLLLGMLVEHRLRSRVDVPAVTLAEGLEHFFWSPLKMQRRAQWKADFDRHPPAYCCLKTAAGDMSKLGYWVLERFHDGTQSGASPIANWIRASIENTVTTKRKCKFRDFKRKLHYGFQWWVFPDLKDGFTGIGHGGQYVHVMPEFDVVVVQFSNWGAHKPKQECESFLVHRKIAEKLAN